MQLHVGILAGRALRHREYALGKSGIEMYGVVYLKYFVLMC